MKPPSRRRIIPAHLIALKRAEPHRKLYSGWNQQDLRRFLQGLKLQQKINSELSLLELRKKVPKHTLLEIQNMVKSLKTRVVRRVYLQVRKQKREERKTKAPIQIWAELAQKMSGVHEETICCAFSQMLVIAATEPCSRLHSDPPRSLNASNPVSDKLRTVTMRPMPRSHHGSGLSSPSPVISQIDGTNKTPVQSSSKDGTSNPSSKNTNTSDVQPSTGEDSDGTQPNALSGQVSAKSSTSNTAKSNLHQPTYSQSETVSQPTPPVSALTAATVSVSSDSNHPAKQHKNGQDHQLRSMGKEYIVDFDKIYQFLNNINMKKHSLPLSAMESAVLLDLLMCLPEELPLLDCKELQHHLLQVHTRLTTTADHTVSVPSFNINHRPAADKPVTLESQTKSADQPANSSNISLESLKTAPQIKGDSSVLSEQAKATESPLVDGEISSQPSAVKPPMDKCNWEAAGLCPLNPFMVPVALLKRQQARAL